MDANDKRELRFEDKDDKVHAIFLNRCFKVDGIRVILPIITLVFPKAPEWLLIPAAELTLIRLRDSSVKTMTPAEVKEMSGEVFDAEQFWAERSNKTRKPVALKPATALKALMSASPDDLTTLKALAKDPAIAKMLQDLLGN